MIRRPPISTLFPYPPLSRSLDLEGKTVSYDSEKKAAPAPAVTSAPVNGGSVFDDQFVMSWSTPQTNGGRDRKSTRLNSSHANISYAVFCLKKKKKSIHLLLT